MAASAKLDANLFYSNYHGHEVPHLQKLVGLLPKDKPRIFLAGDSSLDNKFWFPQNAWRTPSNGYESVLEPSKSRPDIAHLLNEQLAQRNLNAVCVNAAIEESTLGSRSSSLKPQDEFIRDNIGPSDLLVVSVGGNDIALRPTIATMAAMGSLIAISSDSAIEAGNAVGLGHFTEMFGQQTASYVSRLCEKQKPRLVIVSMIYFPHEKPGGSWADTTLSLLRYNQNPKRLQHLIRKVYELGTCKVKISGTKVVPCPLFEILNSKPESEDYLARVEPSEKGGKKMAKWFVDTIEKELGGAA